MFKVCKVSARDASTSEFHARAARHDCMIFVMCSKFAELDLGPELPAADDNLKAYWLTVNSFCRDFGKPDFIYETEIQMIRVIWLNKSSWNLQ